MPAINIHICTPTNERTVELQQPEITIGRGDDSALGIKLDDSRVSRQHGRIWLTSEGYWYEDSNSTGGSKKNGSMVISPVQIFTGDIISVGESTLTIEKADIANNMPDLSELFDVQIQDRLHLHDDSFNPRRPSAKVKVIAQRAWEKSSLESTSEFTTNSFGNLVHIFEYEDQLNDCLLLAIEDIIRLFNPVERGAILLLDAGANELNLAAHYPLFEPAVSTSLIRKTIEEKKTLIWKADKSSFSSSSIKKLNIKMGLYSPLAFGPNQLGVICVDTTSPTADITSDDIELFMNITKVLSTLIYMKQLERA